MSLVSVYDLFTLMSALGYIEPNICRLASDGFKRIWAEAMVP